MNRTSGALGSAAARATLLTLASVHFVLPFTRVNEHPDPRIKIASVVLGIAFASLLALSFKRPHRSFLVAFVLLLAVYIVSAVTGASPLEEGAIVKLVFALALAFAVVTTRAIGRSTRKSTTDV